MRELTDEAASIAAGLGERVLLRDHGGGFTPATVELHRVSAENYAGDPGAAVAAALRIVPASLPTTERRARYWTDTGRAYANWGRRDECVAAMLAAEREAPEETHARPAVRDLLSGLLVTGRTGPQHVAELRRLTEMYRTMTYSRGADAELQRGVTGGGARPTDHLTSSGTGSCAAPDFPGTFREYRSVMERRKVKHEPVRNDGS
jgi:hypothetical protein